MWDIRIATAPSRDSELSVLVTSEQARLLFNCGEGTQRSLVQKKLSLKKVKAVFATSAELDLIGGLPGLLLSAADSGVTHLDIGGPEGVAHYLASCRTFVQRDTMTVGVLDGPGDHPNVIYEDSNWKVKAVPLGLRSLSDGEDDTSLGGTTSSSEDEASSSGGPIPGGSDGSFDWKNTAWKHKHLDPQQLHWWRKELARNMFKSRPSPQNQELTVEPPDGHAVNTERRRVLTTVPVRSRVNSSQPERKDLIVQDRVKYAYIIQAHPTRGKFDAKKAEALKIPGPLRKSLIAGEIIEFDDPKSPGVKRTVRPEEVVGADKDGGACIIVDVTSETLGDLLRSPAFDPYRMSSPGNQRAHVVVHRADQAILRSEEYQKWILSFGCETHHILAAPGLCQDQVNFTSQSWNLLRMSLIDGEIFKPPVVDDPDQPEARITQAKATDELNGSGKLQHPAHGYLKVRVRPATDPEAVLRVGSDRPLPPAAEQERVLQEVVAAELPRYAEVLAKCHDNASSDGPAEALPQHYGIVTIPLGTGSAVPSKYRNGLIMLDAGEGTLGQMRRRYTTNEIETEVYPNLRMVVISHMHADHHVGITRMVADWLKCTENLDTPPELYIVAPALIALHLRENGIPLRGRLRFIDTLRIRNLDWEQEEDVPTDVGVPKRTAVYRKRSRANALACKDALGLTELFTPEVWHRGRAYGFVAAHRSGWKIVYSGDTMPCRNLIDFGKNATLLIHEATLEDSKPEMARAKGHSTFSQAIDVGRRMNAAYLLLNHFSQRYPKLPQVTQLSSDQPTSVQKNRMSDDELVNGGTLIPDLLPDGSGVDGHTNSPSREPIIAMAYDLMRLPLASFSKLAKYVPALEVLFEELEEKEEKEDEETNAADNDAEGENGTPVATPGQTMSKKQEKRNARKQEASRSKAPRRDTKQPQQQHQQQRQKQQQTHSQHIQAGTNAAPVGDQVVASIIDESSNQELLGHSDSANSTTSRKREAEQTADVEMQVETETGQREDGDRSSEGSLKRCRTG